VYVVQVVEVAVHTQQAFLHRIVAVLVIMKKIEKDGMHARLGKGAQLVEGVGVSGAASLEECGRYGVESQKKIFWVGRRFIR
jgi:hypothetical protein